MTDFDPDWPHGHVTRGGRKARIICRDRAGINPIVALIAHENGDEYTGCYPLNGKHPYSWLDGDLVNTPAPKRKLEAWVNFYTLSACAHGSRESADNCAGNDRIACLHITGEEGDGL